MKNARLVIETGLHYTFETMGDHDIGAISPSGVHLELHYQLNDVNIRHKSDLLLTRVWDYVQESDVACKELQDEMFYFYHIMHMAKHFENGGCGIRPFIDLWILNRMLKCDPVKKEKLLVEGGLTTFAQVADQLSNVWMEQAEHTQLTRKMEEYILTGGVYGTQTNQIAIYQSKKGGKVGYILYRIWMPYSSLCVLYPSLKGKRVLQPFYEIRRWFRLLNSGIFTRSKKELKTSLSVSNENKNQIKHLLSQIGLN